MDRIIQIRKNLCIGCGVCANICPQQAIYIINSRARINQELCNHCRLCLESCARGAIMELEIVSNEKLASTVGSLKQKADDLLVRIERLQQKN